MKDILIVIDMQNDFINGVLGTENATDLIKPIKNRIKEYDDAGSLDGGYSRIYFTKDTHFDNDHTYLRKDDTLVNMTNYKETLEAKYQPKPHCIIRTEGWKIPEDLTYQIRRNKPIFINKHTHGMIDWEYASDFEDAVESIVRQDRIPEIEICGLFADTGVVSNALILRALFPEVEFYVSYIKGTTPSAYNSAIEILRNNHINIID